MNRGTLDARLRALMHFQPTGEGVIGVLYESTLDDSDAGLVHVNGSETHLLTPEEFRYDYPNGRLIRVVYAEAQDERATL
jgi:hypothetical protein